MWCYLELRKCWQAKCMHIIILVKLVFTCCRTDDETISYCETYSLSKLFKFIKWTKLLKIHFKYIVQTTLGFRACAYVVHDNYFFTTCTCANNQTTGMVLPLQYLNKFYVLRFSIFVAPKLIIRMKLSLSLNAWTLNSNALINNHFNVPLFINFT